MDRIAIVGAGECGVRAAFELREKGFDGAVTLIGDEKVLPYERPPLSKGIGTLKDIRPAAAYDNANIELRLGTRVVTIDRGRRELHLADDTTVGYDKLLLALGARPQIFSSYEGCLTLRTESDAAAILTKLQRGARVGIIGGGFIGLELAATARNGGADVTVVERSSRILARAVPAEIASVVFARHEAAGVRMLVDSGVLSATLTTITLADGTVLHFDVVIAGIGALPNSELAKASGLEVDNGVVVDSSFRSSDPHIYAAGDCCNFPWRNGRVRLESWKAAQDQGAHVAATMLGHSGEYAKMPWFWSDQYDLTLQVVGLFDPLRATHSRSCSPDTYLVFQFENDGRLSAAAGIGPGNMAAKDVRLLEKLIELGRQHDPAELSNPDVNLKSLVKAA
ncbi:NAD(P)/FAD-dependent oxidoreductase [Rhizobium mesoamericanum]|nr:FAD-dependent oxidoreductase [Rhizobium mesoamericanum]